MPKFNSTIAIVAVIVIAATAGILSVVWLGPDNPIEEAAEDTIKAETGISVDLSPTTPEK